MRTRLVVEADVLGDDAPEEILTEDEDVGLSFSFWRSPPYAPCSPPGVDPLWWTPMKGRYGVDHGRGEEAEATAALRGAREGPSRTSRSPRSLACRRCLGRATSGGLATFTALILIGLLLVFLSNDAAARKGVALALMIAGVIGHCTEAFSMQRNRQYIEQVSSFRHS